MAVPLAFKVRTASTMVLEHPGTGDSALFVTCPMMKIGTSESSPTAET
jgi:hypothetical protein